MNKLTIELIPKTSFFVNLRTMLKPSQWDFIRKIVYTEAGNVCEICGGKGRKHPVECHEKWEYDESTGIQKLVGLIALCPSCHAVKHAGFWINVKNQRHIVVNQLKKVNQITAEEANNLIEDAFKIWEYMSQRKWKVEIDFINNYLPD